VGNTWLYLARGLHGTTLAEDGRGPQSAPPWVDSKFKNAEGRLGFPRAAFSALSRWDAVPEGWAYGAHFVFAERMFTGRVFTGREAPTMT
jgi:hypothetical protein